MAMLTKEASGRPVRAAAETSAQRKQTPIVPPGNIAGQALVLVVAIMSFLACLTVGAVSLIDKSATTWQSQISREATIQVRPADDFDIEAALTDAQAIASAFPGVTGATIITMEESAQLLEPWLGTGLNLEELPVPRLVIVTIDETSPPDFAALRRQIIDAVPNASLDDHRAWVERLVSMARTTTLAGLAVLILVLVALVLTVVFATRGALAGNHIIIEVLHFVGARASFIASQFQRRFLLIGLKGALGGGLAALIVFLLISWWLGSNLTSAETEQIAALFGSFSIDLRSAVAMLAIVVLVCLVTAATARLTVLRTLHEIDEKRADPS